MSVFKKSKTSKKITCGFLRGIYLLNIDRVTAEYYQNKLIIKRKYVLGKGAQTAKLNITRGATLCYY